MNLKNLIFIFLAGVAIVCIGHSDVDAVPKISFATAESSGAESSNIIIEVVLSETSSDNVTVDYEVIGGTAVKGVDYKLEAGTLLFAPGETKKTIVAEMIDDDIDEKDETVIINLKSPSPNALLGGTTIHTYTILDNDTAAASFKMSSSEGEESVTPAEIEVILSNASDHPITVNYKVTGGNAKAGEDFILPDGALTFQPGEKRKKIGATIINDNVAEEDETFIVSLISAVNGEIGANTTHEYKIKDNDIAKVSFTESVSSEYESVPAIKIEVRLSNPSSREITVDFSASGTATPEKDYLLPTGTLRFKPGEMAKEIFATIINDTVYEPDETIIVTLSNPVNAILGRASTHTHWIIDDDGPTENISLFKQEVDTFEAGKKLIIVGPKSLTINPRGMAIDKFGNIYISDQGPSLAMKEGSILMWPKGRKRVIRIITGLTLPGDIELSPDQKTLIVAGPRGDIYRFPLGVSIRLTNVDATAGNTRMHLFGHMIGEKVARVSPDGYFHFLGLHVPGQPNFFYLDVEHAGKTKRFNISLGQPGEEGEPYGHTVLDLEF